MEGKKCRHSDDLLRTRVQTTKEELEFSEIFYTFLNFSSVRDSLRETHSHRELPSKWLYLGVEWVLNNCQAIEQIVRTLRGNAHPSFPALSNHAHHSR